MRYRPLPRLRGAPRIASCIAAGLLAVMASGCQSTAPEPTTGYEAERRAADYGAMIARFETLRREDPSDFNALMGLARYLRYAGRAGEAIEVLESERERFGDEPRYLTELGSAYLAVGEVSRSQTLLERSLDLDPDFWRTYATLAIAYDLQGALRQAAAANAAALEFCPDSPSIRNNMGLSAGAAGDLDEAIAYLSQAHASRPESRLIQNNLELFQQIRASGEDYAASDYRQLTSELHPQDWPAGRDLTCSGYLIESEEIVATLGEQSFIDLMIHFEFDSAVLRPEAEEALDELAEAMMSDELRADDFVIEGHTDAVGTDEYNQGLSERRATSARAYLIEHGGIASSRLSLVGYGESRLLDPEHPTSGVNRRVRIVRASG